MTKDKKTVAILGTGIMGAAVARNLAKKGFTVHAWNRSFDKAKKLEPEGIKAFNTVADAVRDASILITVLKDGKAVEDAIDQAAGRLKDGTIWLQLSTVGVDATDRLASLAKKHGLSFYDAPMVGTRKPAEDAKLVMLASGDESNRSAAQSVFDAIGQRTIWVPGEAGGASRLKLALNAYVLALTNATAETLGIAKVLRIDPALVSEAVTGGPLDSIYFQTKGASMLKGDFSTSFSVENGLKDVKLVKDAVAATGFRVDLVEASIDKLERAKQAGYGDQDISATFLV